MGEAALWQHPRGSQTDSSGSTHAFIITQTKGSLPLYPLLKTSGSSWSPTTTSIRADSTGPSRVCPGCLALDLRWNVTLAELQCWRWSPRPSWLRGTGPVFLDGNSSTRWFLQGMCKHYYMSVSTLCTEPLLIYYISDHVLYAAVGIKLPHQWFFKIL